MTGHAFQVLLNDSDTISALTAMRAHLAPEGILAFETRNPKLREWDDWTPDRSRSRIATPDGAEVETYDEVLNEEGAVLSFRTCYDFLDGNPPAISYRILRSPARKKLAALLDKVGLEVTNWYGAWDRRPFENDSPEIIVTARSKAARS